MEPYLADGTVREFIRDRLNDHPDQPRHWFHEDLETFVLGGVYPDDPAWLHHSFVPKSGGPRRLPHIQIPGRRHTLDSGFPYPARFAARWGQSGWDHVNGFTRFVTVEFDLIDGHPTTGLPAAELEEIKDALIATGVCDVQRSTGGRGYHVRIPTPPIPTPDRNTYGRVRRYVVDKLILTHNLRPDLATKVDWSRGILWLWSNTLRNAI